MIEQVWWYTARAAGLMTWSTAVAAVLIGLLLSTRVLGKKPSGPWLLDVHRFLGGLSVLFLAMHMASLWADSFVDFGPKELFVPGESTWNPSAEALGVSAVTWGIVGAYALIAVQITSILRRYIRESIWRGVHYLSVVTVLAGSVHAYEAGTDVGNPLVMGTAIGSSLVVVTLTIVRMRNSANAESPVAREQTLAEMRKRLDGMPMPEETAQPELDPSEQQSLPRRAPVRSHGPHQVPMLNDQLMFTEQSELEPDFVTSTDQNTLLAGLEGEPTAAVDAVGDETGPEPFTDLPGEDEGFDPGGWSAKLSPAAREALSTPPTDEFAPEHYEAEDDQEHHVDPRSFLPELDNLSPESPIAEPPLDPTAEEPPSPPPAAPIPAPPEPVATEPPPAAPIPTPPEPVATEPVATEPPIPTPPEPVATEPPIPTPPEPVATEPVATAGEQVDVWESALESLLGEGLPRLPSFDALETTEAGRPADPEHPAAQPPVSPLDRQPEATEPPPTPPSAVEPVTTFDPVAPVESEPVAGPDTAGSPPPLPVHAVDPETGEADETAYREWLVEWLAYADRYGDETPIDPSRVDS